MQLRNPPVPTAGSSTSIVSHWSCGNVASSIAAAIVHTVRGVKYSPLPAPICASLARMMPPAVQKQNRVISYVTAHD